MGVTLGKSAEPVPGDDHNVISSSKKARIRGKIIAMAKHSRESSESNARPTGRKSSRQELQDFVTSRRQEKESCYSCVVSEEVSADRECQERFRLRPSSGNNRHSLQVDTRDISKCCQIIQECPEEECSLCSILTKVELYSCRCCGMFYHRSCLLNSGHYQEESDLKKYLRRADTAVGWSCWKCDDITRFLSADEVNAALTRFERFVQKDSVITWEDWVAYHERMRVEDDDEPLTQSETEQLKLHFGKMDQDGDGKIDWWEFLQTETPRLLARRPKTELLPLLTKKEVVGAKMCYDKLYHDKHGKTLANTMHLFGDSGKSVATHKSWETYLADQALFLLCGRPNNSPGLHVIPSHKLSLSLPSSELKELSRSVSGIPSSN